MSEPTIARRTHGSRARTLRAPRVPHGRALRLSRGVIAMIGGILAGCAMTPPDPGHDPVGTWTGALVADQGTCPTTRNSTLQISAGSVTFTPGDGSIVLHGHRGPDLQKYHAQLLLQDANHHPFPLVFDGLPVGQAIGGTYGTPTCRAHVTLTRAAG